MIGIGQLCALFYSLKRLTTSEVLFLHPLLSVQIHAIGLSLPLVLSPLKVLITCSPKTPGNRTLTFGIPFGNCRFVNALEGFSGSQFKINFLLIAFALDVTLQTMRLALYVLHLRSHFFISSETALQCVLFGPIL
ncbi:hypothetical protein V6N11_008160 [Hibiscus sabdariffa]|uniref:Uncharacterized protein n=1 Tax=Hibiscus sabdariffa TaxID=183260 RepID=A0ABR2Q088_9ROSI